MNKASRFLLCTSWILMRYSMTLQSERSCKSPLVTAIESKIHPLSAQGSPHHLKSPTNQICCIGTAAQWLLSSFLENLSRPEIISTPNKTKAPTKKKLQIQNRSCNNFPCFLGCEQNRDSFCTIKLTWNLEVSNFSSRFERQSNFGTKLSLQVQL